MDERQFPDARTGFLGFSQINRRDSARRARPRPLNSRDEGSPADYSAATKSLKIEGDPGNEPRGPQLSTTVQRWRDRENKTSSR